MRGLIVFPKAKPKQYIIAHLLTRDQRDALVAANVYLAILQAHYHDETYERIQKTIDVISDMLYDE